LSKKFLFAFKINNLKNVFYMASKILRQLD